MAAAKLKRRPYSREDEQFIRANARKMPIKKIARALKRTPGAIRQKGLVMGLSLDSRNVGARRAG